MSFTGYFDRSRTMFQAGCVALLAAVAVGCGGSTGGSAAPIPPTPPVNQVSGSIKFGAEVPKGAIITLVALNPGDGATGIPSTGIVQADGSFKINTGSADGAPPGEYVVLVQWFKPQGSGNEGGPNIIPKTYSDPSKSPVKVTVTQGSNQLPPITIPKA